MPIADIDYREYFPQEKIIELQAAFSKYDIENCGSIGEAELYQMFKKLGKSLTRTQLRELLRVADVDGSGEIDFEELCILEIKMTRARPRADLINYRDYLDERTIDKLLHMFVKIDLLGRGFISVQALEKIFDLSGLRVSQDEVDEVLAEVDKDMTGELDFHQLCSFWSVITKRRKRINYREFLTLQQVEEFRNLFNDADLRGEGHLARNEVDALLRRIGIMMKKNQLQTVLRDFDHEGYGDITFEDFCIIVLRIKQMRRNRVISRECCSCASLWRDENFTVLELLHSGFLLSDIKEVGIPVSKIYHEGHVPALELRRAGYKASELRRAGLGVSELRNCGFSLTELRAAGFSAAALELSNRALYSALSTGDLNVLPQQRPTVNVTSAALANADANAKQKAMMKAGTVIFRRQTTWSVPQQLTPRIREHTDWIPVLSKPKPEKTESQEDQARSSTKTSSSFDDSD